MIVVGLMSGTSMDGIDAAIIETDGTPNLLKHIAHSAIEYDPTFRTLLKATEYAIRTSYEESKLDIVKRTNANFEKHLRAYLADLKVPDVEKTIANIRNTYGLTIEEIVRHSAELHYNAILALTQRAGLTMNEIDLIGYHGQTFLHKPENKISLVLHDGKYIAEKTGVTTITDFRTQDVMMGGQGAPFAPIYHLALAARDNMIPCAVVNCGGIGNITAITSDNPDDLIGFDTGPGNALIDKIVRTKTNGKESMDLDGKYGMRGTPDMQIVKKLYASSIIKNGQNYFDMKPPKALDIGEIKLLAELERLPLEDACATLAYFTADSIISSQKWLSQKPKTWILAGGGWKNPTILKFFKELAGPDCRVKTATEAGWNSDSMEAELIAYLAILSLHQKPLSFPSTTSVPHPTTGGVKYTS
jgi:anhydro-N-acetylmuramic acid kinase